MNQGIDERIEKYVEATNMDQLVARRYRMPVAELIELNEIAEIEPGLLERARLAWMIFDVPERRLGVIRQFVQSLLKERAPDREDGRI